MISKSDLQHLNRCIELAREAMESGDQPFGSVLVSAQGEQLFEDRNRVSDGDHTRHPEFTLARWAAENLTPEQRASAVVYTSGEHCAMCAAAHAWVGLGRIVYATSSEQLRGWMEEFGVSEAPIYDFKIEQIIRNAQVEGPVPEFASIMHQLHRRCHTGK